MTPGGAVDRGFARIVGLIVVMGVVCAIAARLGTIYWMQEMEELHQSVASGEYDYEALAEELERQAAEMERVRQEREAARLAQEQWQQDHDKPLVTWAIVAVWIGAMAGGAAVFVRRTRQQGAAADPAPIPPPVDDAVALTIEQGPKRPIRTARALEQAIAEAVAAGDLALNLKHPAAGALALYVQGDRAWLTFVGTDGRKVASSRSDADPATPVDFRMADGQVATIPAAWTVPVEDGVRAAGVFVEQGVLSGAIDWARSTRGPAGAAAGG